PARGGATGTGRRGPGFVFQAEDGIRDHGAARRTAGTGGGSGLAASEGATPGARSALTRRGRGGAVRLGPGRGDPPAEGELTRAPAWCLTGRGSGRRDRRWSRATAG